MSEATETIIVVVVVVGVITLAVVMEVKVWKKYKKSWLWI